MKIYDDEIKQILLEFFKEYKYWSLNIKDILQERPRLSKHHTKKVIYKMVDEGLIKMNNKDKNDIRFYVE